MKTKTIEGIELTIVAGTEIQLDHGRYVYLIEADWLEGVEGYEGALAIEINRPPINKVAVEVKVTGRTICYRGHYAPRIRVAVGYLNDDCPTVWVGGWATVDDTMMHRG